METKIPVKTYQLDYYCDLCKKEPMRPTNRPVHGYPPQYQHACGACGFTKNFPAIYPRQSFEEIPTLVEHQEASGPVETRMTPLEVTERPDTIASMQEKGLIPGPKIILEPKESFRPMTKSSPDDVTCYSPQDELDAALNAAMPTKPVQKKTFPKKKAKR